MKIIPVLDLKDGQVVHARLGLRDRYRPIDTPLCRFSDLNRVVDAFLNLYEFDTFYLADLNALSAQGDHDRLIGAVTRRFPDITFWIDRGFAPKKTMTTLPPNHLPVLGSESFDEATVRFVQDYPGQFILSLDHSSAGRLGAESLFTDSSRWPETVIVMTLARVGSDIGPDYSLLGEYRQNYPSQRLVAAGGIQTKQDLIDLHEIGIDLALVASALHSGALNGRDIMELGRLTVPVP